MFQLPAVQACQRGVAQPRGQVGDGGFVGRRDAAHDGRAHVLAARHQRLRRDEGRGADHLRVLPRLRCGGAPVGQRRAARLEDLDVRDDRQHAVAHLLLEAVHDAEHDDQRGHAQADAEHRHAGDEGNETVATAAAAGPRIAPTDLQLVGKVHRGGMLTDGLAVHGVPRVRCRCAAGSSSSG